VQKGNSKEGRRGKKEKRKERGEETAAARNILDDWERLVVKMNFSRLGSGREEGGGEKRDRIAMARPHIYPISIKETFTASGSRNKGGGGKRKGEKWGEEER